MQIPLVQSLIGVLFIISTVFCCHVLITMRYMPTGVSLGHYTSQLKGIVKQLEKTSETIFMKVPEIAVKSHHLLLATPSICANSVFSPIDYKTRSTWLNQYLQANNAPVNEGHSGQLEAQYTVYVRLFEQCHVRNIAEIGFNAGHSTLVMLMANPYANIQSFDLGEHASSKAAYNILRRQFPRRNFNVIWGDSQITVPSFVQTYTGPPFDILIVDGGHTYDIARADVLNMKALSHNNTILVVDDTMCTEAFCVDKVLDDLENEGVIEVTERIPLSFQNRGMSLARYKKKAKS